MKTSEINSLNDIMEMFHENKPFSMVNYCDGEWYQIMNSRTGAQCDGQEYTEDGRLLLTECLKNNLDMVYTRQLTKELQSQSEAFMKEHGFGQNIKWFDRRLIMHPYWKGEIAPFFAEIKRRKTLVVGPSHLKSLKIINPCGWVETPPSSAVQEIDKIEKNVIEATYRYDPEVITFSASFAAKVLIHRLHKVHGNKRWLLDFGSMWDPFCGVKSRTRTKSVAWIESQKKIESFLVDNK